MKLLLRTISIFFSIIGIGPASTRVVENSKRLIKTSADSAGEWKHFHDVFELIRKDVTFVDITDFDYPTFPFPQTTTIEYPTAIKFKFTVTQAISSFNWTHVWIDLSELDNTRYFATDVKSIKYLLPEINAILDPVAFLGSGSVVIVDHGLQGFPQRSIIARVTGSDQDLQNEVVILGAHLDTITKKGPHGHAPGVDDNASGSSVLLEALRVLIDSQIILKRTIEFHWYAAGEVGLRGSQAIAQEYRKRDTKVVGMLSFDAIGYHVEGVDFVGIFTDDGNEDLLQFIRLLAEQYLEYGWLNGSCGFGCSDHSSFFFNGYPAGLVGNIVSNPSMHTDSDDVVDRVQTYEYFKLAVAFAIELGETEPEVSTEANHVSDADV